MSLREAAQTVIREWDAGMKGWPLDEAITALRAALAQQEQEPVAKLRRGVTGRCIRKRCECEIEGLGLECVYLEPLYTHPPRRETEQEPELRRLHALNGELLEALEALCTHAPRSSQQIDADWDKARAAIARAEGEPK